MSSSSASASGEKTKLAHHRVHVLLGGKPRRAAPLYIASKLCYFFVGCDSAAFAARQGRLGLIDRRQYFQPPPLAFFPKQHGFLHRLFLVMKPASGDGLTNKCLLIGGQTYFHALKVGFSWPCVKPGLPAYPNR